MERDRLLKLCDDVDYATSTLGLLPDMLQMAIDAADLDESSMNEDHLYNLARMRDALYSVMRITQDMITETVARLDELTSTAMRENRESTPAADQ